MSQRFALPGLFALPLGLCFLSGGIGGCKSADAPAAAAATEPDTLPQKKLSALMEADRLISDGQQLKDDGARLKAAGQNGDDKIGQGEQKIADGEMLKAKAMQMKE